MAIHQLIPKPASIPKDLLEVLGPDGLKLLLELIRDAYYALYATNTVTLLMDENDITEELFIILTALWRERKEISLVPIHEKPDKSKKIGKKGKPPTIDFCFRAWDKQTYFGAECKLIEATNKALCKKYVQNGIMRYLDDEYNQKCSHGSMIGYIRKTKYRDVADELRTRIKLLPGNPLFEQTDLIAFEAHYLSKHDRLVGISPFIIHHLLFQFW